MKKLAKRSGVAAALAVVVISVSGCGVLFGGGRWPATTPSAAPATSAPALPKTLPAGAWDEEFLFPTEQPFTIVDGRDVADVTCIRPGSQWGASYSVEVRAEDTAPDSPDSKAWDSKIPCPRGPVIEARPGLSVVAVDTAGHLVTCRYPGVKAYDEDPWTVDVTPTTWDPRVRIGDICPNGDGH